MTPAETVIYNRGVEASAKVLEDEADALVRARGRDVVSGDVAILRAAARTLRSLAVAEPDLLRPSNPDQITLDALGLIGQQERRRERLAWADWLDQQADGYRRTNRNYPTGEASRERTAYITMCEQIARRMRSAKGLTSL